DGAASGDLTALLGTLIDAQPAATLSRLRSLLTASPRLRAAVADQLDDAMATDRQLDVEVDRIATAAVYAQERFAKWAVERVDRLLADLAETFAEASRDLAEATVRETGLGNVDDKADKNRFASLGIYESLASGPMIGEARRDSVREVVDIASPIGVVF